MNGDERLRELTTLKAIAETLNTSLDVRNGLDGALSQLVRLMGLRTGWLFLDEARRFEVGAHEGLPASLTADEHRRLSRGWCQCQDLYRDGELNKAVNIVRCSRLNGGPEDEGLVYHASVPLRSKERMLGILNVAVPGEYLFTETDLALLSAVGYQMGTAIERARLFETERRRSEQLALVVKAGLNLTHFDRSKTDPTQDNQPSCFGSARLRSSPEWRLSRSR